MTGTFYRVVGEGELASIRATKTISGNRDTWHDYAPGTGVFLFTDMVTFPFLISRARELTSDGVRAFVIAVSFTPDNPPHLIEDASAVIGWPSVLHVGPIDLRGRTCELLASFDLKPVA